MLWRKLKLDWKYAIGEFMIVLVGVLVALAFDGMVEDRAEREAERRYLASLESDLTRDIESLDIAIARADRRARLGERVIAALDGGSLPADPEEFGLGVHAGLLLGYPQYSRGTIEDLISTGNLGLIRSSRLKEALFRYYGLIDYHDQFRPNWRAMQIAYEHTIPHLLSCAHRQAMLAAPCGGGDDVAIPCGAPQWWWEEEFVFTASDAAALRDRMLAHPSARGEYENMTRIQGSHLMSLSSFREEALGVLAILRASRNR